jgi:hypothetical protein
MSKSAQNKKTKTKTKRKTMKRKYRGGTYYSYNRNPLRFTSSTLQKGGKFTLNTRDTLIPQNIVNMGRTAMYNSSSNPYNGYYPAVNPDPSVQPINKSFMIL